MRCATGTFSSFVVLILAGLLLAISTAANAALVNDWKFDDGTGSTTAVDSGPGLNDGTLTNMDPTTDWVAGVSGAPADYALDFDGGNDHVQVTGYKGITGTDPRSMSGWIKTTDQSASIISWGKNVAGQKWTFRVQNSNGPDGTIRLEVNSGYQVGSTPVDDDNWHHVVATWEDDGTSPNANDVRLWVDGRLQGVGADNGQAINTGGADPSTGNDVRIGTSVSGDGKYFNGQIDEVHVYSHALSRNEVRALAGLAPDLYFAAVHADSPIAYWRLGEPIGSKAFNEGSLGSAVDGDYNGGAVLGEPGLLTGPGLPSNTAVRFDGGNDRVNINDHAEINTGGPYTEKSIEAWFSAEDEGGRNVIYEQGGGTHGLNLYHRDQGGNDYLYYGAWHNNGTQRNHFPARVQIELDTAYHAVSAYNDATNTFILYLNGAPVSAKVSGNIESIPAHTGDVAIGRKHGDTRFDSGSSGGNGNGFQGTIDEVALYNSVLDLRTVQTHYAAGTGDRLGIHPGATLGVALNYDAGLDDDGDTTWQDTIGTRPNGAGLNQFDWTVSSGDVPRVEVGSVMLPKITHAYEFDGSDAVSTRTFEDVAGRPDRFSASFELVFKPDDFSGDEALFETGGATDGLSFWLDDNLLRFDVKDNTPRARAQFDLTELSAAEQADFIHVIGVADLDNDKALLYVNGVLRHTALATNGSADLTDWAGSGDAGLGSVAGALPFGSPGGFLGQIALFRFYPSTLTADEIAANYGALVPEPSTMVLLALGLVGLAVCGGRRKRRGA